MLVTGLFLYLVKEPTTYFGFKKNKKLSGFFNKNSNKYIQSSIEKNSSEKCGNEIDLWKSFYVNSIVS